jgi:hypothetical protein
VGIRITGAFDKLPLHSQYATATARDQMAQEVVKLAELARKMAPVDKYDLEQAILTEANGGDIGRRTQFYVFVADELNGVNIRDYVVAMHEQFGAAYQLGPASLAKQAGQPEIVGGKFLERAFEERKEPLVKAIGDAVKRSLKQ